jgi:hypothetical protein
MRTTTQDIERIISGEALRMDIVYPLDDMPEGFEWYMKQPTDWLMDMASAVREAAEAKILALPEVQAVADLPPSGKWQKAQEYWIDHYQKRIAELEAMDARDPEDELELLNTRVHVINLITAVNDYTRALEIASPKGNSAFYNWLAQRLVADAKGKLLCDPNATEGRERWERLGSEIRQRVITYVPHIIGLVSRAKNYKASQPSTSS